MQNVSGNLRRLNADGSVDQVFVGMVDQHGLVKMFDGKRFTTIDRARRAYEGEVLLLQEVPTNASE